MFYLSRIEHTLRVPPDILSRPLTEAIKVELEKLFLDKVIANLGLCISVYDIISIEGGFIFPGDGAATYTAVFTMIMFRPFVVTLGFFEDIYIPANFLPDPSRPEPDPRKRDRVTWIWEFGEQKYVIDGEDEIRFQVHSVNYPPIPVEQPKESKPFAPMVITGSLDCDGLGPVSWWDGADESEE
ncbi:DNA-directed RNA polymerase III subunit RPC8 isoform X2 [Morus notabilis]|uniref:DNA-directed RNA polymerase III subunit RPC8 isoform X2 n=1 Tax=Morus notabilis TaxID=981085 RepID=UPI000CECE84B|nr:DNA-directed RNA polymerase III subunit RPC8 isoform X2 [Morus notabilis]